MRRHRRSSIGVATLWIACGWHAASAQNSTVDDPGPFPALEDSVLRSLGLDDSILSLGIGETLEDVDTTLRRITIELASRGMVEDATSPLAALAAIRIDAERTRILRALLPIRAGRTEETDLPDSDRKEAVRLLVEFARRGLETLRRADLGDAARFDDAMRSIFQPLLDAVVMIDPGVVTSPWPTQLEPERSPRPTIESRAERQRDIDAWIRSLAEDHPLRPAADRIVDPPTSTSERFPTDLSDLALLRAAWGPDGVETSRGDHGLDISKARERILKIVDWPSTAPTRPALVEWVEILDLAKRRASFRIERISRPFDHAARRVATGHRRNVGRAEAAWMTETTSADRFDRSDVDSAIAALRTSARDLDRVETANRMSSRMSGFAPDAGPNVTRQLVVRTNGLGGDRTRGESARILDRLAHDLDRFQTTPLERTMSDAGSDFSPVTGGRDRELIEAVEAARRRWIEAIGRGVIEGDARDRMDGVRRLADALDVIRELEGDALAFQETVARCNRWGGWFASGPTLEWTDRTLIATARLATLSAIDDGADLRDDLRTLEHGLALLEMVRLLDENLRRLGLEPSATPADAIATLAVRPGPEAWGLPERLQVARIARAVAELRYLRNRTDTDRQDQLETWLRKSCEDLVDRWSEPPTARDDSPTRAQGNDR